MSLIKDLKKIGRNTFHAKIVLTLLYLEKISYFKLPFRILRKIIIQGFYSCEIHPDSFRSKEAIATCRLPHPLSSTELLLLESTLPSSIM